MPDEQFDIVRDIEKARKTIEEKGGTPRVFYISRKQYENLSEKLRTSGWLKEGQDGKEYIFETELRIWDDLFYSPGSADGTEGGDAMQ